MMQAPPAKEKPVPIEEFDGYRLVRLVGQGMMGNVYLAHDTLLDRPVAVKFIASVEPNPQERERFFVEARAIARLQHPNVVTIYRVGEVDGQPYLISEFVRGETLEKLAKPVPWQRALRIAQGLARGLAAAHRSGVLHRDIKPANAILSDDGEAKLLDFGLAKLMDLRPLEAPGRVEKTPPLRTPAPAENPLAATVDVPAPALEKTSPVVVTPSSLSTTRPGAVMGTPLYMAPETWRGEPATFRSDLYSLGALLYHLCAGRPPHDRTQLPELRSAALETDALPLAQASAVEPRFAAVIDRCLRRDPGERYASAEELREALDQLGSLRKLSSLTTENPYQGLQAFEAKDRAFFFGRDGAIRALIERLRGAPFTLVVGDSGVGKSSLCRAGVLPAVEEGALGDGWKTVTFVPSRHPVAALAAALAPHLGAEEGELARRITGDPGEIPRALRQKLGAGGGILLFVDQFEELITQSDRAEAVDFVRALGWLWSAGPSIRLLVTIRGDFLTRLAALPGIADELGRALYLLRPLSREGIREAVIGPAAALGVRFESEELIATLVESTAAAEGGLPLLQFALAELWSRRDREAAAIRASALAAMGGVAGALARHADGVLEGLRPEQRDQARRIFLELVSADRTRVQKSETELGSGEPAAKATLDALVRGRLLVALDASGGAAFDIAHEALIRGWPTLRRWLDETRDQRALRERIARAVAEWERLGQVPEALWGARQLAEAARLEPARLPPREVDFLEASRRAVRRARMGRGIALVALPVLLAAVGGGIWLRGHRAMEEKLQARLDAGSAELGGARRSAAALDEQRRQSFALFDRREIDAGEQAWSKALELQTEVAQRYTRASRELETAFSLDSGRREVRALFADILIERAFLAEAARRPLERDELLQRLALFDEDGERRRRWSAPAVLTISTTPADASFEIERFLTDQRGRRRPELVRPAGNPHQAVELDPGSYQVTFRAKGRALVHAPVRLERGERFALSVDLPAAERVPEGFAYVPPGRFLFGTKADEAQRRSFFKTVPIHPVETRGYLIARHETTWADWIKFLDALSRVERARYVPRLARFSGALKLQQDPGGRWRLTLQPASRSYSARAGEVMTYPGRKTAASQDWLNLPVSGISWDDAQAYTAWLARTGRLPRARLCEETEWERAARGADDREYPHGDELGPEDANFDETYGKEPLSFGPDAAGSHPASRSPFGVDDMVGNVWEWTSSALVAGERLVRGGSFYHDRNSSRSTNREVPEPALRDLTVGMRVCASVGD